MAMVTSASAVIVSLGSRLLKKIRIHLFRIWDITLIFGLNESTLDFGRKLLEQEKAAILYVDHGTQGELHNAVDQMGALVRSDSDALEGNVRFLKSIGLKKGKRKLKVYALVGSMIANQQYAARLQVSMEKRGILSEQTSLTILSATEGIDNPLQACGDHYGFGTVIAINKPEMWLAFWCAIIRPAITCPSMHREKLPQIFMELSLVLVKSARLFCGS